MVNEMSSSFFDFKVLDSRGQALDLSQYKGKVVLVVNVASRCGFTPQYIGLEEIYRAYKDQGFVVLGFPCNQFGKQEPGTDVEIQEFCQLNYDVTFPVMKKVEVNGDGADPVFKFLKCEAPGLLNTQVIKWNFTKFLVGRDGKVLERFAPAAPPEKLRPAIEAALTQV